MQELTRVMARTFSSNTKTVKPKERMVTAKFYLQNYALFPILILCVADVAWLTFCSIRTFMLADDVIVTRKTKRHDELTDLLTDPINKKMVKYQVYTPNLELVKAYKEMKDEELRRKKECERGGS